MRFEVVRRARVAALACTLVGAGAAWLSAHPATAATVLLDGPGVAVYADQSANQVFFRGDDAGISHSYYSGTWVGPSEVPGTARLAASGPGVVVTEGGSVINEFFRGTDGGILQTYYKSGHGWRSTPVAVPGSSGRATTNPAADLSHSGQEVDVFFRGMDGGLWQSWYIYGGGWHGPAEVPGTAGTASAGPAVTLSADGDTVEVFYRGSDGGMREVYLTTGHPWVGPIVVPRTAGMVTSGLAADTYHGGIDIYFRGPDAGLYESWYVSGSGWHGPAEIPGTGATMGSPPAADVFRSGGETDVFWFTPAGRMLESYYPSGGPWHGPTEVPRVTITPPPSPSTTTTTNAPAPVTTPAPVTATPAPVTIPPPPPAKPHARRCVRVKLTIKWTWNHGATRMGTVKAARLPRGGHITVTCRGPRCPRPHGSFSAVQRTLGRMWRHLRSFVYRPGDRLRIVISARGYIAEEAEVRIHDSAKPTARLLRR